MPRSTPSVWPVVREAFGAAPPHVRPIVGGALVGWVALLVLQAFNNVPTGVRSEQRWIDHHADPPSRMPRCTWTVLTPPGVREGRAPAIQDLQAACFVGV
ncbi:MAG: hypothetical protein ACREMQ_20925 [Longimicrobiales bacterium]